MSRRYVIIGSSVASLAAAESIGRHDPAGDVSVVGDDPDGYYSRPGIAYYLDGTIPEQQLFPRSTTQLRQLFPHRIHGHVAQILVDDHEIALQNGRRLHYDRLLLATGAGPIMLPFPGNDLKGIVKLDTLDDVRAILRLVQPRRPAVVVGGGIIGMELAEGLAARGMLVHHLVREDTLWWPIADVTESKLIQHGLQERGVRVHLATQMACAVGRSGRVVAVETQDRRKLPCSILGVAIGVRPRSELAKASGIQTERGILVDEYLQTSAPDVFAAGNAAQVRDPKTGGTWLELLWGAARIQGEVAGANMTGGHRECNRSVSINVVKVGGIVTATIGNVVANTDSSIVSITGSRRDVWYWARNRLAPEFHDRVSQVRILVGERNIVGAVVMGDQTPCEPLLRMVELQVDISPLRPALAEKPSEAVGIVADFCRRWQRSFAAAWG